MTAGVDPTTGGRARRRQALLLACSTFADAALPSLRSPAHDVSGLAAVLSDPAGSEYEVNTLLDGTAQEARLAIEDFFAEAHPSDLHLLYFSTHGRPDDRGELHFAFADTLDDRLGSTAVAAEWVRARLGASRSRTTIVLVDCCFSGRFLGLRPRSGGSADVGALTRGLPEGSGVVVLTASGETELSYERWAGPDGPSYFTEALVTGIGTGAADLDGDGEITVDELYQYVFNRIVNGPSPQRPHRMGQSQGRVVISKVSRRRPEPAPPTAPVPRPAAIPETGAVPRPDAAATRLPAPTPDRPAGATLAGGFGSPPKTRSLKPSESMSQPASITPSESSTSVGAVRQVTPDDAPVVAPKRPPPSPERAAPVPAFVVQPLPPKATDNAISGRAWAKGVAVVAALAVLTWLFVAYAPRPGPPQQKYFDNIQATCQWSHTSEPNTWHDCGEPVSNPNAGFIVRYLITGMSTATWQDLQKQGCTAAFESTANSSVMDANDDLSAVGFTNSASAAPEQLHFRVGSVSLFGNVPSSLPVRLHLLFYCGQKVVKRLESDVS